MESTIASNSRIVRIAASLFFFLCVPMSLWETGYVHAKVFVFQDPVATAANLKANEFIFRVSMISHIMGNVIFILMAMLFHKVLSPVDKHLSRLMVIPLAAQLAIVFALEIFNYAAVMTLKSDARATFDIAQQQEVAYFLLRLARLGVGADKIMFGLCLIPFGMLVYKSRFAPRVIGILMIVGGVGYLIDTTLYVVLQRTDYLTIQTLKLYSSACYSLSFLWFLIKGVRDEKTIHQPT